jgi:hypothetical protein
VVSSETSANTDRFSLRKHRGRHHCRAPDSAAEVTPMIDRRLWLSQAAFAALALVAGRQAQADKPDLSRMHGKFKVVDSFPDYKVKVVDSFADLHVKVVDSFPDDPGEWQMVESFPDYKIQFVESFPDFTIKYVSSFPGVQ